MKRLTLILLAILFGSVTVFEQAQAKQSKEAKKEARKEARIEKISLRRMNGADVNVVAKNNFITDFGKIPNVQWRRTDYLDEARFTKNGKPIVAYYEFDGKLVGTTEHKTFADLPINAQNEIRSKYRDYSIGPVIFFDDNELNETDMVLYGMQFDDKDNYFVELTKGARKMMVRVDMEGFVSFFKDL